MRSIRERSWAGYAWVGAVGVLCVTAGCGARGGLPAGVELLPDLPAVTSDEYLIDVGDLLDIDFFYQPELSRRVVVRPDGRITVPGLGEMEAAGHTPRDLSQAITGGFADLLRDPLVTVSVSEMAGSRIFVVGEVVRPGGYALRGRITLSSAISEAGGFTRQARPRNAMVVRRAGRDRPRGVRVDASGLEEEGVLSPEIVLSPYDIVYVPRGSWWRAREVISFLLQPGLYYLALLLLREW